MKRDTFRKFVNRKISYIFHQTLVLSIICTKCGQDNRILHKKKVLRY